ncbi:Hydroxysteroid dehydrogenase-like protein-like protein [Emericellopsis cladophorae]|uniref:Hydroxysteroid dehydrogenase-like protein-like protein n=1 Tax=Emericellopsis cladophorae TaxID=2686198 RepID=A0A9Q0BFD1_9HYPO|nr:Hydroxysteroid dehydrogenase-like protein-like protein [Emericellopsis cladophorae]KAI6783857.1 Hydroxysteroid dehydrogenase-like protein-like protein [Emericellopsis cladophorae]
MAMSTKPVAIVVGASRGLGRQIALSLASNNYAVVVAAKTTSAPGTTTETPDPNSPASTITTVTNEIRKAGGDATAIQVDVRFEESIKSLISQTISTHGRLDVLVYNSGAIHWAPVKNTPLAKFKLMQSINPTGLFTTVHFALPHLLASPTARQARIVVISPPIYSRFFRGKTPYAMGKVGMSVLTKGLAMDIQRDDAMRGRISITSLWPAVAIESAATQQFTKVNPEERNDLRKAAIFGDAVLAILKADGDKVNGELLLDEDFLREQGVTDFDQYNLVPGTAPRRIMPQQLPDLTVAEQDDQGKRYDSSAKSKL